MQLHLSVREAMIAASPLASLLPPPPPPHLQLQPGEESQGEVEEEDGGEEAQPTPPSLPLTQSREVDTRGAGGRGGALPVP